MSKTFSEVMMHLSSRSQLDNDTKVPIGTATTYMKAAYDMLGKINTDNLEARDRNSIARARSNVRDSVIELLAVLTNDNAPNNIYDLLEASE